MNEPRSIESNLLSFGLALGSLIVLFVIAIFSVEHALGGKLARFAGSTVPAQQAITGMRGAVSQLFERQVRVLSTRSDAELAPLESRAAVEQQLSRYGLQLAELLPAVASEADAAREGRWLTARTSEVLASDAALFQSVRQRHRAEADFGARALMVRQGLERLRREVHGIAGAAHLEYVLDLRRVAGGAPARHAIHGVARARQEAAEQVVAAVLRVDQLLGKLALTRGEDELNSIAANELAQNLARARTELSIFIDRVQPSDPTFESTQRLRNDFVRLSAQIAGGNPSLVGLRRSILREKTRARELDAQIRKTVRGLSSQLDATEHIVAEETQSTTRAARLTLWVVRGLSLSAFMAAIFVGLHSSRRLRASVRGLRAQNVELETLGQDLTTMNERLEAMVVERSQALAARERSMRLVLDSLSEGLVPVDLQGRICGECSRAALAWFGEAPGSGWVVDYLFGDDEPMKAAFRTGYAQMCEDFLPFAVCADCMPKRFSKQGQIFSLDYRRVLEEGRFVRVLVVVGDISAQVESEARESDAREQHQLLASLLRDKHGFQLFVRDTEQLLYELHAEPGIERARRILHTLKGNASIYGLHRLSQRCEMLEDLLEMRDSSLTSAEATQLSELWRARLRRIDEMLTADSYVELREADLDELVQGLRKRRDYPELLDLVEAWKWTKTAVLLRRLALQIQRLAERFDTSIQVRLEHNNLRVMPGALDEFWGSLIHLVRNALDHGIEPEAERERAGKPVTGTLLIATKLLASGGFALEFADDGRGIDLEALRGVLARRGVTAITRSDLVEALCQGGLTTCKTPSEVSGSGRGLATVVAACRAQGGDVDVETELGFGTRFRFSFPKHAVQVRETAARGSLQSLRPHVSVQPKSARHA